MGRPDNYTVGDFLADVDREFEFLVAETGFVKESTDMIWRRPGITASDSIVLPISDAAPLVRFRSGTIEVSIGHDPRGEIQVLIRCPDRPPGSVDVEGMARLAGVPRPGEYSGIYGSSNTSPAEVLGRLASALRDFGSGWLTTDASSDDVHEAR